MEKSLVFGGRCTVLSMSYSQERLSWRTCQLSLFEGLEQYLDRYPKSGTMRNGVLYERVISEHLIRERDGSALHTQKQSDSILTMNGGSLPTPTVNEAKNNPYTSSQWKRNSSLNVEIARMFLPTPTCHEIKQEPNLESQWIRWEKHKVGSMLGIQVCRQMNITKEEAIGKAFQLHPHFVEEMMGFPIGWTELQP